MKTTKHILFLLVTLVMLAGCRDKELDMTLVQETWYRDYLINEITADDAWSLLVVQDDGPSFVELEYSAFMEDYIRIEQQDGAFRFYLASHPRLPNNTVLHATIHTPAIHQLHCSDAVFVALEGQFPETAFTMELDDAATCRGGHFYGTAELKLDDASTCVEFYFEGTSCSVELDDASVFKGCLNVSGDLNMRVDNASRLTHYWGEVNQAEVEVSADSYLNMANVFIQRMHLTVQSGSEATVNVVEHLEGSVRETSCLYYSGDPILNVDCDETSTLQHVEYPNPD